MITTPKDGDHLAGTLIRTDARALTSIILQSDFGTGGLLELDPHHSVGIFSLFEQAWQAHLTFCETIKE
jgi:hypothetical protein